MNGEPATKQDLQEFRQELRQDMQAMELRIVERLTELGRRIETKLLGSFVPRHH